MVWKGFRVLGAVAVVLALAAAPAGAEDITYLFAESACQPGCASGYGGGNAVAPGGCGASFCGTGGFIAGAELVVLRPYAGSLREIGLSGDLLGYSFDDTLTTDGNLWDITPRLWFGYVSSTGLGVRMWWWEFNHDLRAETGTFALDQIFDEIDAGSTASLTGRLHLYAIDLEVMQRMDLGLWRTNVGAGLRYAGMAHQTGLSIVVPNEEAENLLLASNYYGVGPTAFAELRRPIGCHGLALVGTARGSVLFGSKRSTLAVDAIDLGDEALEAVSMTEKHETGIFVGEVQFGLEWSGDLAWGGQVFVQSLWEGQLWSGLGGLAGVSGGDLGLMGFTFNAGIRR